MFCHESMTSTNDGAHATEGRDEQKTENQEQPIQESPNSQITTMSPIEKVKRELTEQATAILVTILMDYGMMQNADLMKEFRIINGFQSWNYSFRSVLGPFTEFIKSNARFKIIDAEKRTFSVCLTAEEGAGDRKNAQTVEGSDCNSTSNVNDQNETQNVNQTEPRTVTQLHTANESNDSKSTVSTNQNQRERAISILISILNRCKLLNINSLSHQFTQCNDWKHWNYEFLDHLGPFTDFIRNCNEFEIVDEQKKKFKVRLSSISRSNNVSTAKKCKKKRSHKSESKRKRHRHHKSKKKRKREQKRERKAERKRHRKSKKIGNSENESKSKGIIKTEEGQTQEITVNHLQNTPKQTDLLVTDSKSNDITRSQPDHMNHVLVIKEQTAEKTNESGSIEVNHCDRIKRESEEINVNPKIPDLIPTCIDGNVESDVMTAIEIPISNSFAALPQMDGVPECQSADSERTQSADLIVTNRPIKRKEEKRNELKLAVQGILERTSTLNVDHVNTENVRPNTNILEAMDIPLNPFVIETNLNEESNVIPQNANREHRDVEQSEFAHPVLAQDTESFVEPQISAEQRKSDIANLWGLSVDDINMKLALLLSLIPDAADNDLLDILNRADLQIEVAANLYFEQEVQRPVVQMPVPMELDDEEDDDYLELMPNHNNRPRKRKRIAMEHVNAKSNTVANAEIPSYKRRKLSVPQMTTKVTTSTSNTTTNTNSSSNSHGFNWSSNTDSTSFWVPDMEQEAQRKRRGASIQNTRLNPFEAVSIEAMKSWKSKVLGTLRMDFVFDEHREIYNHPNSSLSNLQYALRSRSILPMSWNPSSFPLDHEEMDQLCRDCILELDIYDGSYVSARRAITGKLTKNAIVPKQCKRAKQKGYSLMPINKEPGTHFTEIQVTLKNQFPRKKGSITVQVRTPMALAVFGGSADLARHCMKWSARTNGYGDVNPLRHPYSDRFQQRKLDYSLCGLLNFCCREKADINPDPNGQDQEAYGLNVTLHPFQLQTLQWMVAEERDTIGFHRHFYEKGKFEDETPFWYSAITHNLVINGHPPVAHGGLLCEEMGLGKTIICLALIQSERVKIKDLASYSTADELKVAHTENIEKERWNYSVNAHCRYRRKRKYYKSAATLVIAPTSLVAQWEKECDSKSSGRIWWKRYYGASRSRDITDYVAEDIVFTTYGMLSAEDGSDCSKHVLHQIKWHRIILDESHCIKNANAKTTKNILKLRGVNKWCATGTPFGKTLFDISNQFKFIGMEPAMLSKLDLLSMSKRKLFNGADKWSHQRDECNTLLAVIESVVMRHRKTQQFNGKEIVSMPEREENVIFVEFTTEQRAHYNKVYGAALARFQHFKRCGNLKRGTLSILASLHPARQLCSGMLCTEQELQRQLGVLEESNNVITDRYAHRRHNGPSIPTTLKMAKRAAFNDQENAECPICFECPLDEPLQTPCRHLFCGECLRSALMERAQCPLCRKRVDRTKLTKPFSTKQKEIDESVNEKKEKETDSMPSNGGGIRFDAKFKVLIGELNKIRRTMPEDKVLIFSSFSKSVKWLCAELKRNGLSYRTLSGNMSMSKRKKQLEEFSSDPEVKVFVLTVRSGAVGLTLTAANHVFLMEPPFNPALYRQAINRVHRLGQKKKVFIHSLIIKDSVEQRIWSINQSKQRENGNGLQNDVSPQSLAGNINADRGTRLAPSDIEKLFE